jgi:hypothetical protein
MKRLFALSFALFGLLVAARSHAGPTRPDVIVQLDPSSMIDVQFETLPPATFHLKSGVAVLGTNDASCTTSGCKASLNTLAVTLDDFTITVGVNSADGSTGTAVATLAQPAIDIYGPIEMTNDGRGFVVPAGTAVQTTAFVSATVNLPQSELTFRDTPLATIGHLTSPLFIQYQVSPQQLFTMSGAFSFEFRGSQTVSGQLVDIDLIGNASILGSGQTPFLQVSPCALVRPVFFGTQGVAVADGSTVKGAVYSESGGQVSIGNGTTVGRIVSLSPVLLRDRASVTSIDTNAGVTQGNSDHIGTLSTSTPVLLTFPRVSPQFIGTQAVSVTPDSTLALSPGQYGAVTVFSRAHLVLSAGEYNFTSLDLEPQAVLVAPSATSESAQLFVRDSVIYRGSTLTSAGSVAPLYLAYTGSSTITIESPFLGTILAPNAPLTLQSLNGAGTYVGEFFANQVTLAPNTAASSDSFSCK